MKLESIKDRLLSQNIFMNEDKLCGKPTVIGYDKQFRFRWFATQMNTFVVASDFGDDTVTANSVEQLITEAFAYATKHYSGWPRGFQSGLAVIVIMLSSSIDDEAITYCKEGKTGKKWAGFSIPVAVNTASSEVFLLERNPAWGRIYYSHFRKLINATLR